MRPSSLPPHLAIHPPAYTAAYREALSRYRPGLTFLAVLARQLGAPSPVPLQDAERQSAHCQIYADQLRLPTGRGPGHRLYVYLN